MRCCVIWISRCEKDHTGKSVTLSWSIQMFGVQNSSVHHHFLKTLLFINISTGKVNYLNQFPLHPILVLFYIFLKTSWFKLQLLTAEGQITKQNPSEFDVASLSLLKTPRALNGFATAAENILSPTSRRTKSWSPERSDWLLLWNV